jgi:hypothetical protein
MFLYCPEFFDSRKVENAANLFMSLGDAQRNIRCPTDDDSGGILSPDFKGPGKRPGTHVSLFTGIQFEIVEREGAKQCPGCFFFCGETVMHSTYARRKTGVDDRSVSGTTAEISCDGINDSFTCRGRGRLVEGEKRHHNAGRAESALAPTVFHHSLLHRMKRARCVPEILDGNHLLAVEHRQEDQTGIDSLVAKCIVAAQFGNDYRTRPAVALRAPFFHTPVIRQAPEVLKKRGCGSGKRPRLERKPDGLSVKHEMNGSRHLRRNYQLMYNNPHGQSICEL